MRYVWKELKEKEDCELIPVSTSLSGCFDSLVAKFTRWIPKPNCFINNETWNESRYSQTSEMFMNNCWLFDLFVCFNADMFVWFTALINVCLSAELLNSQKWHFRYASVVPLCGCMCFCVCVCSEFIRLYQKCSLSFCLRYDKLYCC